MEVFNTLMAVFIMLSVVSMLLMFALWRSTRSKHFLLLILHWFMLLICYYSHHVMATSALHIRALVVLLPTFASHISLVVVYRNMFGLPFPWKMTILSPLLSALTVVVLFYVLKVTDGLLLMPLIVGEAIFYFYAVYEAYQKKRNMMTFSLKAISVLFVLTGLHLFDYVFFYNKFELLAVGFAIAIGFEMATAILFPAAIIEKMTGENERLKNGIEFQAKLTHSAKMMSLGEMAGGIAHELNNPLTILILSLDKLKNMTKDDAQVFSMIQKCLKTTERMNKIIRGLLTYSREDFAPQFNKVNVSELINETLTFCSVKLKSHHVALEIDIPDKSLNLIGNGVQLSQVLLNLVNNSFDAVVNQPEKWIQISVKDLGDKVGFSVTDSGAQISEATAENMFNPFFTTKDVGMGTGLGLSISKGIIENHKGRIYLDDTFAHTRVVFIVPKIHNV